MRKNTLSHPSPDYVTDICYIVFSSILFRKFLTDTQCVTSSSATIFHCNILFSAFSCSSEKYCSNFALGNKKPTQFLPKGGLLPPHPLKGEWLQLRAVSGFLISPY